MKRHLTLLATALTLLGVLMLASCTTMSDGYTAVSTSMKHAAASMGEATTRVVTMTEAPKGPQPELVFVVKGTEASGNIVYAIDTAKAPLVFPFMHWVDDGYYDNMYIARGVPGLFIESDNGYWSNRAVNHPIALPPETESAAAGSNDLGLVQNKDGTFGPRIVMMRGMSLAEGGLVPANGGIGELVEGADILKALRKGDKIVKAYGRNFPAAPEPYY